MAGPTSQSTGLIAVTAGTLKYIGKNIINGIVAMPGATVTVYDNAVGDTSGNMILQVVNANTSSLDHIMNIGVRCDLGLTVVVSGTTTGGIVFFGGN